MPRQVIRRRARAAFAAALVGLLAQSSLLYLPAQAARKPVKQAPRPHQVLVVTGNLEEAWDERDKAEAGDLAAFVRRMSELAPHAPDVFLLQEITLAGSRKLVKLLHKETSQRYAIAASAGKSPVNVKPNRVFTRETAILINLRTMKRVGKPRYIDTTHSRRHGVKGTLREVKRNAAALVRERSTGLTIPVASVHFHTAGQLRSEKASRRYRKIWSRRIDNVLQRTWPRYRRNAVIGGDFNDARHRVRNGKRVTQRWWEVMRNRGYRDSIFEVDPYGGVDYIFTRTKIAAADLDRSYSPDAAAGTAAYYADHKMRWALLGSWRPVAHAKAMSSTSVRIRWKRLPSAKKVVVQRTRPGSGKWHVTARAGGRSNGVRDFRLEPSTKYRYRVVAWNGAERSTPSRVMRVRTPADSRAPKQPKAPRLGVRPLPLGIKLRWPAAHDRGGSGVAGYEVWRTEVGRDPRRIRLTDKQWFVDKKFTKRGTVEYFVIAYDRYGNRSRRSEAASILPRLRGRPS